MFVTRDVATVPGVIRRLSRAGEQTAGVAFIPARTIAPGDVGAIVRRLVQLWSEVLPDLDPTDLAFFIHEDETGHLSGGVG
jgi:hypothetical protein